MKILSRLINKINKELNLISPTRATTEEIRAVFNFYNNYQDYRSLTACAKITNLSIKKCARIRKKLYRDRLLGLYYFQANTPPQKFMLNFILDDNPQINNNSKILEVGPGDNPIFLFKDYPNWIGVDKYFFNNSIEFKENNWAINKYPKDKIFNGSFENLSEIFPLSDLVGQFDLIVGSHSYEHAIQPIKALKQTGKMLKSNGKLIIFVPIGYSDDINTKDPTHTVYINPLMITEFFEAAGGFTDIKIKDYRPNADYFISATKI